MKVVILRTNENSRQTLGTGIVYDSDGHIFMRFNTLELPYLNNRLKISCIKEGKYIIVKRESTKFGKHLLVKDVKNRSFILIHHGNYYTQTEGCILVGSGLQDLNDDTLLDVTNSVSTMSRLLSFLSDSTELTIINNF